MDYTTFERISENKRKDPLYYQEFESIDKENKEIKRSLSAMNNIINNTTTPKLLSKKDFLALKEGRIAYETLLQKRQKSSSDKKNYALKKKRKQERGAKWLRSEFNDKVNVEFMIKVIYLKGSSHILWNYGYEEIEREFTYLLESWGLSMETKKDAEIRVQDVLDTFNNKEHKNYKKWEQSVEKALIEYEKNKR